MTWPVLDVTVPLADMLGQATHEVELVVRAAKVSPAAPFRWTMETKRSALWLTCDVPLASPAASEPQPCGTHAAFARHRAHGEQPCEPCVIGEREYQRARHVRRRAKAVAA